MIYIKFWKNKIEIGKISRLLDTTTTYKLLNREWKKIIYLDNLIASERISFFFVLFVVVDVVAVAYMFEWILLTTTNKKFMDLFVVSEIIQVRFNNAKPPKTRNMPYHTYTYKNSLRKHVLFFFTLFIWGWGGFFFTKSLTWVCAYIYCFESFNLMKFNAELRWYTHIWWSFIYREIYLHKCVSFFLGCFLEILVINYNFASVF